jgi:hypothetical protein
MHLPGLPHFAAHCLWHLALFSMRVSGAPHQPAFLRVVDSPRPPLIYFLRLVEVSRCVLPGKTRAIPKARQELKTACRQTATSLRQSSQFYTPKCTADALNALIRAGWQHLRRARSYIRAGHNLVLHGLWQALLLAFLHSASSPRINACDNSRIVWRRLMIVFGGALPALASCTEWHRSQDNGTKPRSLDLCLTGLSHCGADTAFERSPACPRTASLYCLSPNSVRGGIRVGKTA